MSTPEALRDAGMAQAEQAADPRIILAIDAAIEFACMGGKRWSANDIRAMFPVSSQGLVGNRVRSALMRKLMVQVGEERSTSGPTHAKKIGVYIGAEHVQRGAA